MKKLNLKPAGKSVLAYYEALEQFKSLKVSHESAVRAAFQNLLEACCRQFGWALIAEWPIKRSGRAAARVDGALVDDPVWEWRSYSRRIITGPRERVIPLFDSGGQP
jgi:hypothetical protein